MKIVTDRIELIADLHTPVGLFLRIRDLYTQVFLLESSDYSDKQNSKSFLCCEPLMGIKLLNNEFQSYTAGKVSTNELSTDLIQQIQQFVETIEIEDSQQLYNGLFGYTAFDAISHFESIDLKSEKPPEDVPILRYDLFRFMIVFDHFYEKLIIIENRLEHEVSQLDKFKSLLLRHESPQFPFKPIGDTSSTTTDEHFKSNVSQAKIHCQRGDIFQVVLSRRFSQAFKGDDFNVYRALRSINPSPYLFYFDYGDYRIFGSSPEAQIIIADSMAEIHPIAGTMPRTGDSKIDEAYAAELAADPKENAEHVMLVDLARNDLSRNCKSVYVDSYKETQYFSHVMHLTSKVKGQIDSEDFTYQIFADTFPAGTLSGAPKIRAMEIIDNLEAHKRGFYGGSIGYLGLNGQMNHAIIIRSFLSQSNTLHFQAGAGIVIDSKEEKELQEVNNKLAALRQAIIKAENI